MIFPPLKLCRFWLAGAVLVFVLLRVEVPLGFSDESGEGQEFYRQAMQLSYEKQYAEAEDVMLHALKLEPSNPDYHFQLSNIYAALYDTPQARPNAAQAAQWLNSLRTSLEQTLIFNPEHLAAHFNLGVLYKRQGRYEDARNEFRRVLELSPDLAAAWFQLGSTYQNQGFWDEAEDAYLRARELSYDSYEINQTLQEMQIERETSEHAAARRTGFGGLGSGFGSSNGLGALGGAQNLYGNTNQQGNGGSSVLPSLAAMMLQQMLSRRSSNDASSQ